MKEDDVRTGIGRKCTVGAVQFFYTRARELLQGRLGMAILMHFLAWVVWIATVGLFGWLIHLWSIIDAAVFKPRQE
jgi:uncharacterized membrane protein YdbT with pleckstrin-like domain